LDVNEAAEWLMKFKHVFSGYLSPIVGDYNPKNTTLMDAYFTVSKPRVEYRSWCNADGECTVYINGMLFDELENSYALTKLAREVEAAALAAELTAKATENVPEMPTEKPKVKRSTKKAQIVPTIDNSIETGATA